jgi:hypothetical protein
VIADHAAAAEVQIAAQPPWSPVRGGGGQPPLGADRGGDGRIMVPASLAHAVTRLRALD